MADDSPFLTLDASQLQDDLVKLLCRIAKENGRIEINNCEGGACVMISKAELDSLEMALAILVKTDGVNRICSQIQEFARMDLLTPEIASSNGEALCNT